MLSSVKRWPTYRALLKYGTQGAYTQSLSEMGFNMAENSETLERGALFDDPQHSIIAIFRKDTPLEKAVEKLHAEGFGENDVALLDDSIDQKALDESEDGPLGAVRNLVAHDEVDIEGNYKEAIRLGHTVVVVSLSDDEEEAQTQRNVVRDVFFSHEAEYVHYFGERTFEEVMVDSEDR